MPKAEKGSLKDLGKRIKAKGLQKLKFWCELCQKQCRDANGFQCHMQSESHLRQMKLFSESAGSIVSTKSREFERSYLETLSRMSTGSVNANVVYQQVIRDKTHVHMNATMWATLSDFVQYLGKHGKAVVEETERGWFVKYINRNAALRQAAMEERQAADAAAEAAFNQRLEQQRVEAARLVHGDQSVVEATNLERSAHDSSLKVSLAAASKKPKPSAKQSATVFGSDSEDNDDNNNTNQGPPELPPIPEFPKKQPKRDLPSNDKKDSAQKKRQRTATWLYRDIIVRIVDPQHRYYKSKAAVDRVDEEQGMAHVTLLEGEQQQQLVLSQEHLETVVPKRTGEKVRLLTGKWRGKKARVVNLDKKRYQADLEFSDGTVLEKVDFDEFSQVA